MSSPDLHQLTRDPTIVAAVVSADELFGLLKRALNLPPYWAALLTTAHGERRFCRPGSEMDGRDAEEVMLVRTAPLRLNYRLTQLSSADHFPCEARIELELRPDEELSAAGAYRTSITGSMKIVRASDVQSYFAAPVEECVRDFVRAASTVALLDNLDRTSLANFLRDSLEDKLFGAGMKWSDLLAASVDSPLFRQERQQRRVLEREHEQQQAQSRLREATSAAQQAHLVRLEQALARLKTLTEEHPHADLAALVKTFDETQRGELHQALWSAPGAAATRWIVVASGQELVYYDPTALDQPLRRAKLDTPLGPLRSLVCERSAEGEVLLLMGAARGAAVVRAEDAVTREAYPAPALAGPTLRGGFNAVAIVGDQLLATHSEIGLVHWRLRQPDDWGLVALDLTAGAQTVRHVCFRNGHVWLSIDERVCAILPDGLLPNLPAADAATMYCGSASAITALFVDDRFVLAGNSAGDVLQWSVASPEHASIVHSGGRRPVEDVAVLRSSGVPRLFFADTTTAVSALVLGDTFLCRYRAGGQTIRRAEVADDWIVATNENRDRLLCWPTSRPSDSPTVIPVAQLTGHSIQDVCLVPCRTAAPAVM